MPGAIFDLLWTTIRAGSELFAYIVNLAADGAHYWVFAHVTPTIGANGECTGFHSNRRTPDPGAVHRVIPLYRELCAEEARHQKRSSAIEASSALLARAITAEASCYDEFVWSLARSGGGARRGGLH